ncbi:hypothetical protein C8R45DRAFT_935562 [Mycena sanguinolenta]|nr:hypothetical protein C8R45DRAFT_935562 [Mycena sanguinolenta]
MYDEGTQMGAVSGKNGAQISGPSGLRVVQHLKRLVIRQIGYDGKDIACPRVRMQAQNEREDVPAQPPRFVRIPRDRVKEGRDWIHGWGLHSLLKFGLRKFNQCKGFDAESQDLAEKLGCPLFEVCVPASDTAQWDSALDADDGSYYSSTYSECTTDDETDFGSDLPSLHVEPSMESDVDSDSDFAHSDIEEFAIEDDCIQEFPSGDRIVIWYCSVGELAELVKFGLIVVLGIVALYEHAGVQGIGGKGGTRKISQRGTNSKVQGFADEASEVKLRKHTTEPKERKERNIGRVANSPVTGMTSNKLPESTAIPANSAPSSVEGGTPWQKVMGVDVNINLPPKPVEMAREQTDISRRAKIDSNNNFASRVAADKLYSDSGKMRIKTRNRFAELDIGAEELRVRRTSRRAHNEEAETRQHRVQSSRGIQKNGGKAGDTALRKYVEARPEDTSLGGRGGAQIAYVVAWAPAKCHVAAVVERRHRAKDLGSREKREDESEAISAGKVG